jgi:hypothetical protein
MFAPAPTAVFFAGIFGFLRRSFAQIAAMTRDIAANQPALIPNCVVVIAFFTNVLMMISAVVQYRVWSIMHGRLFFPTYFGALIVFATGVEMVDRWRVARIVLLTAMFCLGFLFVTYLSAEALISADIFVRSVVRSRFGLD